VRDREEIMLKTKDIKAIETGPRQLTFGFEGKTQAKTAGLVVSFIMAQIKAQARKFLLDSPDKPVERVDNRQVEAPLFRDLVNFYQQLMNRENMDFKDDQYEFASSLLSDLTD